MKSSLFIAAALLFCVSIKAQTAGELEQHRLKYKTDLHNDIKADTALCDFFPFSQQFIITATVEVLTNQPTFNMTTSSGKTKEAWKYVRLRFTMGGKTYQLYGYRLAQLKDSKEYADHFFVPFKDLTTNKTTYASGRYLDFTAADIKDGKLVIDFNKAYNPYCAFTEGYNCPIPPKENTLQLAVTAGEKKYRGHE